MDKTRHPALPSSKLGVLLINLGTPERPDYFSIRRYLSEFLSDRRVIDYPRWLWQPLLQGIILTTRPFRTKKAYQAIWNTEHNASPLRIHTQEITEALKRLHPQDELVMDYAMRYGTPSVEERIQHLVQQGCRKILFVALYPQYSATTTATAYDACFSALKSLPWQPAVRTMPPWHDHPLYIQALAKHTKTTLADLSKPPEVILTSFHGLPKRYLKQGDPYHCACHKTSRLLREALSWPESKWRTTFQSRFGPEQWLSPYTDHTLIELAKQGVRHVAVLSPAFVCECLETLEEIAMEAKATFLEAGGTSFTYIPCLNASETHIHMLDHLIQHELSGWLPPLD